MTYLGGEGDARTCGTVSYMLIFTGIPTYSVYYSLHNDSIFFCILNTFFVEALAFCYDFLHPDDIFTPFLDTVVGGMSADRHPAEGRAVAGVA